MTSELRLLAAYENTGQAAPIEHTFDTLLTLLGVRHDILPYGRLRATVFGVFHAVLTYGSTAPDLPDTLPHIHIQEGTLFGSGYGTRSSLPSGPPETVRGVPFIFCGVRPEGDGTPVPGTGKALLEGDIVASSFYLLSQYGEAVEAMSRNSDWRVRAEESYLGRYQLLSRPIVNEYVELLQQTLRDVGVAVDSSRPWGKHEFAVCLTHDIDGLEKFRVIPPLRTLAHIVTHPRPDKAKRALRLLIDYALVGLGVRPDPYLGGFQRMMSMDQAAGMPATYFFLADGSTYSLADQGLRAVRAVQRAGGEVALHPGFGTARDFDKLRRQAEVLSGACGEPIRGSRQHYLALDVNRTWSGLEQAAIEYDSTLGYNEAEGFRCGVCHPYRPFDVSRGVAVNLWEIPLQVMDATLFVGQALSEGDAWERVRDLIDTVERYRGVLVVLWHNAAFYEAETPDALSVYRKLLDELGRRNCTCLTASDIVRMYTANVVTEDRASA